LREEPAARCLGQKIDRDRLLPFRPRAPHGALGLAPGACAAVLCGAG